MGDRYATQNLSRVLTTFASINFGLGGGFIADRIFPVVRVPTTTGEFYHFLNTLMLRDDYDTHRPPKGESPEIEREYSEDTYACQQEGLHELIADEELDNADRAVIDPERDSITAINRKLKLGIEIKAEAAAMSTSIMGNNAAATACWDAATAYIEDDIDAAKETIRLAAGVTANTIIIPPAISVVAKKDAAIRELIKYTDPRLLVNGDLPPVLFNLEVVIPGAIKDTANPGIVTPVLGDVWRGSGATDNVLVAYIEKMAPSKRTISLGYQFRRPLGGSMDVAAFRYRDNAKHGNVVEGLIEQVIKITCADCGCLITGTIT